MTDVLPMTDTVPSPMIACSIPAPVSTDGAKRIQELAEENARLRSLAEENRRLKELAEENARLRALADENAALRALLIKQADACMSPPISPVRPVQAVPVPEPVSPTPRRDRRRSSNSSNKSKKRKPSAVTTADFDLPTSDDEPAPVQRRNSSRRVTLTVDGEDPADSGPLRDIIELLRQQLQQQTLAQDELLNQFGELRSSHAQLQASTSDVTDELICLRERSSMLESEVDDERRRRLELERENQAETNKVALLRSKVEESRRAVMRLQDEAAQRRTSDSRRTSVVLLSAPGSSQLGGPDSRRGSIVGGGASALALGGATGLGRRASLAVCESNPRRRPSIDTEPPVSEGPTPAQFGLGFDCFNVGRRASIGGSGASSRSHRRQSSLSQSTTSKPVDPIPARLEEPRRPSGPRDMRGSLDSVMAQTTTSGVMDSPLRHRDSLCNAIQEEPESGEEVRLRAPMTRTKRASFDTLPGAPNPHVAGLRSLSLSAGPGRRNRSLDVGSATAGSSQEVAALKAQLAAVQAALAQAQGSTAATDLTELPDIRRRTSLLRQSIGPDTSSPGDLSRKGSISSPAPFGNFSFGTRNPACLPTPPQADDLSPGTVAVATFKSNVVSPSPDTSASGETAATAGDLLVASPVAVPSAFDSLESKLSAPLVL